MKDIIVLQEKVEIYPIDIKAFDYYKSVADYCENVDLVADILELEPYEINMGHVAECMLANMTLEETLRSEKLLEEELV